MNVLILGSGGREHAFSWKIAQSKKLKKLYIAPGNAGTAALGENLNINPEDNNAVIEKVIALNIDLVVVGSEGPLVNGIVDDLKNSLATKKVLVVGPDKRGAELEGSKKVAKEFMVKNNIPTARYKAFTPENISEGFAFIDELKPPYVLKADGLAAGKGVLILSEKEEAKQELKEMLLNKKFGNSSAKVVIEEFLHGIELSVFVLTDGKSYKILPAAKDYKRIGEGDTGLNTGGMGAISPVPFADASFLKKVEDRIAKPTIEGFKKEGFDYKGFVFIGLMNVGGEPFVIEYNVRMGDPETEVVLPRIKTDFLELMLATANQTLDSIALEIDEATAVTVMVVSGGYPEDYQKGKEIKGLEIVTESQVFHAGTKLENGKVVSNGGRVLAFTSSGKSIDEALAKSYRSIEKVSFDKMYFRRDIGFEFVGKM